MGSGHTVIVEGTGAGSGAVSADGIDCEIDGGATEGDCAEVAVEGETVTLSATADQGSVFIEWTGCDSTTGAQCQITFDGDKTVTANFDAGRALTVEGSGTGDGNVADVAGGSQVDCDISEGNTSNDCTEGVKDGTTVTLEPTEDNGSAFMGWSGCDAVFGDQCEMTMDADKTVTAEFDLAPLIINSTGDAGDDLVGDESCDTGETIVRAGDEEPECTLRAIIEESNSGQNTEVFTFDIPNFIGSVPTISPDSELPGIQEPVVINGASQPSADHVILDGGGASGADGLRLLGGESEIQNVTVRGFSGNGIVLDSPNNTVQDNVIIENGGHGLLIQSGFSESSSGNVLEGNQIGLDADGFPVGNGKDGVHVDLGATSNQIGGAEAAKDDVESGQGNVISGNDGDGIEIEGLDSDDNVVVNNRIGTAPDGMNAAGTWNQGHGIVIDNASGTVVRGNTISGNDNTASDDDQHGVYILGSEAQNNVLERNRIGTTVDGMGDLGNGTHGVLIENASNNTVGSGTLEQTNVISANGGVGVAILGSTGGSFSGPAGGNVVQGNIIGTDLNVSEDLGNAGSGVVLEQDAPNNTVDGNVIVGNGGWGVEMLGPKTTANRVQGNIIGDVVGNGGLRVELGGNDRSGIGILNAPGNTVGGDQSAERNVIAGNAEHGVEIEGAQAGGNRVVGNQIGVGIVDAGAMSNGKSGIFVDGAPNTEVGGATGTTPGGRCTGACNLISGNAEHGIEIRNADGTQLKGNFIGTDPEGTAAIGNAKQGIRVAAGSQNTQIGGATPEARNLVSGNDGSGIELSANRNLVQGNYLGVQTDGVSPLGNQHGVIIVGSSNLIGGTGGGTGNVIAYNDVNGITVTASNDPSAAGRANALMGNTIHDNGKLGIDLGNDGITPNDEGDADDGPNGLQNFPLITSVTEGSTTIEGTLNSTSDTPFRLEFFSNSEREDMEPREGETFLGFREITTDGNGEAAFEVTFDEDAQNVTATATRMDPSTDPATPKSTSEFFNEASNTAPTAVADSYTTGEDQTLQLVTRAAGVLANDSDPDGDALTAFVTSDVSHGRLSLNPDGTFTYEPTADFDETDTFVYEASDGTASDPATVTIEVQPAPDAPTVAAIADRQIAEDEVTEAIPVTIADADVLAESLRVSATSSNGSLVPDSNLTLAGSGTDRTLTAAPLPDSSGSTTLTVTVDDAASGKAVGRTSFGLTVTPVNDAPVAVVSVPPETLALPGPDLELVGVAQTVFRDVEDDPLSLTTSSNAPSVVAARVEGDVVTLTPQAVGTGEVTLTASDGTADGSTALEVTVVARPGEEEVPSEQASAAVGTTGETTTLGFGATGTEIRVRRVKQGGGIEVRFFESRGVGQAAAVVASAAAHKNGAGDEFADVSPYRWEIEARRAAFEAVDVRFRLADADVTGVTNPETVTIVVDTTGDGTFVPMPTRFDDGGTPSDSTDDVLAAEGLTALGTFRFASDTNPLPVELSSFTATLDGRAAVLRWRTVSETNNAGFEVQHRAPEGTSYAQVGYVDGAGTTQKPQRYRFRVADLVPGTHRFRLQQVDTDGTATPTEPVVVRVEAQQVLTLEATGPNPVRETTRFGFTVAKSGRAQITLYNVLGQEVKAVYDEAVVPGRRHTVDVRTGELPSGTYFVRLKAPSGTRSARIVVVR